MSDFWALYMRGENYEHQRCSWNNNPDTFSFHGMRGQLCPSFWYDNLVIVFDPKNDNKKILVGNYWSTVNDQETWTRLVNGNERLPWGYTNQVWGNEIREIWFTDNQFYGYITHAPNVLVSAQIVDETTVRVFRSRSEDRRNY
jgi:hypothetical protein